MENEKRQINEGVLKMMVYGGQEGPEMTAGVSFCSATNANVGQGVNTAGDGEGAGHRQDGIDRDEMYQHRSHP